MAKYVDQRRKKMGPAIAELKIALNTVRTNEPINRREGDTAQANLEKNNAASFRAAIMRLRNG